MLRAMLIATLFAGCASGSRAPAWPKQSAKAADGGESLAPRRVSPLAKSDVASDDETVTIDPITEKPVVKATEHPVDGPARPTVPTVTSPDVIINIDDIVIDLDD
jgi:hypothetical protein